MRIIITEKDRNMIDLINEDLKGNKDIPLLLNKTDKDYWIRFRVTDIAKANNFIWQLFYDKFEDIDEGCIKREFGLDIKALDYSNHKRDLIDRLRLFINELENEERL